MLNINTNYGAAFAAKAAKKATNNDLNTAFEELSSGSINFAKDDAAGQGISTRLAAEYELRYGIPERFRCQSMIDKLVRIGKSIPSAENAEIAVQASNGTLSGDADRTALDMKFQS